MPGKYSMSTLGTAGLKKNLSILTLPENIWAGWGLGFEYILI